MDKDVLEEQLKRLCDEAMTAARAAVEQAPDGEWIEASEWEVRGIFQKLARDCYELLLQAKADQHPAAGQAAFSPSAGRDPAQQRPSRASDPDGWREH